MTKAISLALGPLLFNWPAAQVRTFYAAMAQVEALDRVYLGEVVCAKRRPLHAEALAEAAGALARAGKEVVWSTLALPASGPERRTLQEQLREAPGPIEINDASALFSRPARSGFVAGPLLNAYNEDAAQELVALGCVRLCGNVELSLPALAAIGRACPTLELELFAFGRLPLALSGRCYHARAHDRRKDTCQFVCDRDPDGLTVRTLEGQPFLAINGVQVVSHGVHLAAPGPQELAEAGVTALRLSPQTGDMAATARAFRAFLDGRCGRDELERAVAAAGAPGPLIDGYLHGEAGRLAVGL